MVLVAHEATSKWSRRRGRGVHRGWLVVLRVLDRFIRACAFGPSRILVLVLRGGLSLAG